MAKTIRIDSFLDNEDKITQLPQKHGVRYAVLAYLAEAFKMNVDYTEHQVNDICNGRSTFGDCFLLRRELVDNGLLCRERDGSRYWRAEPSQPVQNDAVDIAKSSVTADDV